MNVDPVSAEASDSRNDDVETEPKKEIPVLASKKAVVEDNIEKLKNSIEEFSDLAEDSDVELSELTETIADLVNFLNEKGLAGK